MIVHLITIVVDVALTFEVFILTGSNVRNMAQMKNMDTVKRLRRSNTKDRLNDTG